MQSITDTDLGTPRGNSDTTVSLEIDGFPITVPAGSSILYAASAAGTKIPKLCATDSLEAF